MMTFLYKLKNDRKRQIITNAETKKEASHQLESIINRHFPETKFTDWVLYSINGEIQI